MKKRFHLLIITGILLVGFIIGSFLDLQINQAIFQKHNGFGLFMASFGVYPCYMGFAFAGGGLLITSMKEKTSHYGLRSFAILSVALFMY